MPEISIIIPLRNDESAHHDLVTFLINQMDPDLEIIPSKGDSRADALNKGARKAKGKFLWFIHADTKINSVHITKLKASLKDSPNKIHYFDLEFENSAPFYMRLNAWGANMRSKVFGFPWGDQALAISTYNLDKIGYFDKEIEYGEDHALIIKARMMGIELQRIDSPVITSSRAYKDQGWLKLTLQRQISWPKLTIYLREKYKREFARK